MYSINLETWKSNLEEEDKIFKERIDNLKRKEDLLKLDLDKKRSELQKEVKKIRDAKNQPLSSEFGIKFFRELNNVIGKSEKQLIRDSSKLSDLSSKREEYLKKLEMEDIALANLRSELELLKNRNSDNSLIEDLNKKIEVQMEIFNHTLADYQMARDKFELELSIEKKKNFESLEKMVVQKLEQKERQLSKDPEYQTFAKKLNNLTLKIEQLINNYNKEQQEIKETVERLQEDYVKFLSSVEEAKQSLIRIKEEKAKKKERWPDVKTDPKKYVTKLQKMYEEKADDLFKDNSICEASDQSKVALRVYQEMVGELMRPFNKLRGLLLYHDVGTGKTTSALQTILRTCEEYNNVPSTQWIQTDILVLLPTEKLIGNFKTDLQKLLPAYNVKKQKNEQLVITSSFFKEKKPNTMYISIKLPKRNDEIRIILHKFTVQIDQSVRNKWLRDYALNNQKYSGKYNIILPFKGLIIVDEAHNLVNPSALKTTLPNNVVILGREISNTRDIKLLLMTATPVMDSIFDMFKLLNMLKDPGAPDRIPEGTWRDNSGKPLPGENNTKESRAAEEERILFNDKTGYLKKFKTSKGIQIDWKSPEHKLNFQRSSVGLISYVTLRFDALVYPTIKVSCGNNTNQRCEYVFKVNENGEFTINQNTTALPLTAEEKEAVDQRDYRHIRTIKVVVPLTKNAVNNMVNSKSFKALTKFDLTNSEENSLIQTVLPFSVKNYKTKSIVEYSNKVKSLGVLLDKYPNEKHFVYTSAKNYGDGPQAILDYLKKVRGYEVITRFNIAEFTEMIQQDIESKKKGSKTATEEIIEYNERKKQGKKIFSGRYVIYFGRMVGDKDAKDEGFAKTMNEFLGKALELFNQQQNTSGQYIQVFVGDRTSKEGVNLKAVKHVHLMEPPVNKTSRQQAIGRALRFCSHSALKVEERTVRVYTYVNELDQNLITKKKLDEKDKANIRIEEYLFEGHNTPETSDFFLKALEEVAIDCLLLKNYNHIAACSSLITPNGNRTKSEVCYDPGDEDSIPFRSEELIPILEERGINVKSTDTFSYHCRLLGGLLAKDQQWTLEDQVLYDLLEREKRFKRKHSVLKTEDKASGVVHWAKKAFKKALNGPKNFISQWYNRILERNGEADVPYNLLTTDGRVLDFEVVPMLPGEENIDFNVPSYDIVSKLMLHKFTLKDPNMLYSMILLLTEKDGDALYAILEGKKNKSLRDQTVSEDKMKKIERNAKLYLKAEYSEKEIIRMQEELQKAIKKKPKYDL